eukprot:scaffold6723_cov35-Phaeocystis_antarctica.AAC.1
MAGAVPFSLGIAPDGTAGSQAPRLIAAAARPAAACPSGDRATHNAASSAVAKLPRCTGLPPRLICTWKGLGRPGLARITPNVSPSTCACCRASSLVSACPSSSNPSPAQVGGGAVGLVQVKGGPNGPPCPAAAFASISA